MDEQTNVAPIVESAPPVAPVAPQADLTKPELNAPHYAGGWIRFLAIILDGIILGVIAWILGMLFISNTGSLEDVKMVQNIQQFISVVYFFLFMALKQQTPGMMILKLRLISLNTGKSNWWIISLLREVLGGFVCALTLGIGYLIVFWTPKKQGLHDYIAGTTIIRE